MRWLEKLRTPYIRDWYSANAIGLFIAISLLYFMALLIKRMLIINDIAAFEVLQDRGEMWVFDLLFGLEYLSVPLFLVWKFVFTTLVLWIGCFMFGYRLTFAQLWKLVVLSELVFILPEFLKVIWFLIIHSDPDYHEFVAFYPLSLINIFDFEALIPKFLYPLKALNLFEVFYWFFLAASIFWISGKKWSISLMIVFTSYVPVFLMWLLFYIMAYR
ncbi:MAG: hypothetical protein ABJG41_00480 [Cyclobacteriaceae bacterium]